MPRPLTAFILSNQWAILDSPDPLYDVDGDRCMALPDEDQRVIWIDPSLPAPDRPQLLLNVVGWLWNHRLRAAVPVD